MQTVDQQLEQWTKDAAELGAEHARNAASWATDGNMDPKERAKVLEMMRDGDPAAWDYLPPQPNLSGAWGDSPTPRSLFETITGLDAHAEATWNADAYDNVSDALCDAYENAVSETFGLAVETELIAFCR